MKLLNMPTEFKLLGDAGQFEGYASIFGNVDLGGDVVERGAFKEVVKNAAGKTVVLWQHISRSPIGVADVNEDSKGLHFTGDLVLDDPQARVARAHMKAGSATGMSIGYDVLPGGAEILKSGVRSLKALKLWEISVVTWGMNPEAGVDSIKACDGITTIREFETWLRDAGGFTKAQATALASGGWKTLQAARDGADESDEVRQFADFLKSIYGA